MSHPNVEVADILRVAGRSILDRDPAPYQRLKVMRAITGCRTARLGGHIDTCTGCGKDQGLSYNSCRDRHCPKCQARARQRWLTARQQELLPVPYFHVVFTLPHKLNTLIRANPERLYTVLFRAVADTLLEVAANPKRPGAEIGFFAILHTWTQTLVFHPHIHCVVPAGGLAFDHSRWIHRSPRYFLPKEVLQIVFRAKFSDRLTDVLGQGRLRLPRKLESLSEPKRFRAWLRTLHVHQWIVYTKRPFGGPEQVLRYLGRYTHRVAISNHRLVDFDGQHVRFRWRDRQRDQQRILRLSAYEFSRRFLLHVLPRGFVRIRYFGFMANFRRRESLELCRQLIGQVPPWTEDQDADSITDTTWRCPECQAPMRVRERLTAAQIALRTGLRRCTAFDTS